LRCGNKTSANLCAVEQHGTGAAVARIFGFHVSGLLAWLIWLFIHLMNIVQFQSRILVFIQWGFQYLTFSRGARLITGEATSDCRESEAHPTTIPRL
jgi:NADH dehydrogenase